MGMPAKRWREPGGVVRGYGTVLIVLSHGSLSSNLCLQHPPCTTRMVDFPHLMCW